jgi:hypothetical protein
VANAEPLVGGGVRDVRRAACLEFLAQHGYDLLAEDLDLLEDDVAGETGVVDEEELSLVVADPVGERQGALDDLLGGSHGQRGHLRELLEARTMPVYRRVVEVGAELLLRLGLGTTHEDLTTEADGGLVGRAVPIMLEASAVEVDHLRGVLEVPEDVVVEEAVAVVGGLFGDLRRADGAMPDERRSIVHRPRREGESAQRRPEFALPIDDVLAPQLPQKVIVLNRERDALTDVLTEPRVDRSGVSAPHHQVDTTAGEVLQERKVLGDASPGHWW